MATNWQDRGGSALRVRPWWRPLAISAATAAAIAALFNPLPAAAAPPAAPGTPVAVPDAGSRPIPLGTLVMPGQASTTPATAAAGSAAGVPTSPLLAKLEKQRAEIAALGDKLIQLGQDRDLARQQQTTADQKAAEAQTFLTQAQQQAAIAAAASLRDAAALPPGSLGSGLADLDALARMQRGESISEEASARQLEIAQAAMSTAQAEQTAATTRFTDLSAQYNKLNTDITAKQAALQKFEQKHSDEISAAEAAESAQDQALGAQYLAGAAQGRGADPRAIAALTIALAQRGKPYKWSEEGSASFDCSGLMFYSYHSQAAGNFPLKRVSRDQYLQTDKRVVDRYSLLAGDLLFFSSSNSWTGIHHVAMYAGDGMMVEAPRTGLNVRLTPVRWTRLFQATRVWGSVDGATAGPDLHAPAPPHNGNGSTPSRTPTPTGTKTTKPTQPTKPATPSPSSASPSHSTPPSTSPSTSTAPTTGTSTNPPAGGSTSPTGSASSSAPAAAPPSDTASDSPSGSTSASSSSQSASATSSHAASAKSASASE